MLLVKVLRINLSDNSWRIEDTTAQGPVTLGVKVHNEANSWGLDPFDPPQVPFVIGMVPSSEAKCQVFIG